jgi:hypothetical protein
MKKPISLLFIAAAAILTACMNPPPRSGEYMTGKQEIFPEESERMQVLRDAGKDFSHVVTVPASDNMLSNGTAIFALKRGSGSGPADSLLDILRAGKAEAVAVVGKSDALTAATIEAAIKQLDGSRTDATILFAGKPGYVKKLRALTDKAGVSFEGMVFPPQGNPEPDQAEPD